MAPSLDLRVGTMRTSDGGSHQENHLGHQIFLVSPLDRHRKTRVSVAMSRIQQLEDILEM